MADGGNHRTFRIRDLLIPGFLSRKPAPPEVDTTRYLLLPEFPFKTAQLLFGSMAAEEGAAEMVAAPPEPKQPLEDEDILAQILCRLPPLPSPLARAFLVSRLWARLGTSAFFRRRFQEHHRKPPVLGLYERGRGNLMFIPTMEAPDAVPPERFSLKVVDDDSLEWWDVLGCRHGRVLVVNRSRAELLLFDPVSGDRHLVAFPPDFVLQAWSSNGAVVVNEPHEQSPNQFKVVLVGVSTNGDGGGVVSARVYSSETGAWGDLVSTPEPGRVGCLPCALVGDSLYWWLAEPLGRILCFDHVSQTLTVIDTPDVDDINIDCSRIIRGSEDGGVGLAVLSYPNLRMYDRKVDADGVTTWPLRKTVEIDIVLGLGFLSDDGFLSETEMEEESSFIVGYSEEANAVVMSVYYNAHDFDLFIVQLDSMEYRELEGEFVDDEYHPFAAFYTGGPSVLQLPARVNNDGGAAV